MLWAGHRAPSRLGATSPEEPARLSAQAVGAHAPAGTSVYLAEIRARGRSAGAPACGAETGPDRRLLFSTPARAAGKSAQCHILFATQMKNTRNLCRLRCSQRPNYGSFARFLSFEKAIWTSRVAQPPGNRHLFVRVAKTMRH